MKRTHWSQSPGPLLHVPHIRAFSIEIEIHMMFLIIIARTLVEIQISNSIYFIIYLWTCCNRILEPSSSQKPELNMVVLFDLWNGVS